MSSAPVDPGQPAEHPEAVATVQQPGTEHAAPAKAFGLIDAPMFIALAMIAVFALMIWKKVPAAIARALDSKIAVIRDQLAEAESLRKEAEAIKAEYAQKASSAEAEAAALLNRARGEADEIIAKAKVDAAALIDRRTRMAEDKIASEERAAVKRLQATAADAAVRAASRLISERLDSDADARLVDQSIGEFSIR